MSNPITASQPTTMYPTLEHQIAADVRGLREAIKVALYNDIAIMKYLADNMPHHVPIAERSELHCRIGYTRKTIENLKL